MPPLRIGNAAPGKFLSIFNGRLVGGELRDNGKIEPSAVQCAGICIGWAIIDIAVHVVRWVMFVCDQIGSAVHILDEVIHKIVGSGRTHVIHGDSLAECDRRLAERLFVTVVIERIVQKCIVRAALGAPFFS